MSRIVARVDGVTRRFGDRVALDDVSFSVSEGEVFGLLGHNGAGKTTLLRVLNGLLVTHGGTVEVFDLDPVKDGKELRRHTGVLTEYPALADLLTAYENLAIYASISGMTPAEADTSIRSLLEVFALTDRADVPVRGFSAGLKQRVSLARALVHRPEMLLLDEPTTNMDPVAARDVRSLIKRVARSEGRTVILSTHNLAEAAELCDRVAIIRQGRIVTMGSISELSSHYALGLAVTVEVGERMAARAVEDLGDTARAEVITGRTLTIHDVDGQIPSLVRKLVEAGHDVSSVVRHEPTLEDVYLRVHHEESYT